MASRQTKSFHARREIDCERKIAELREELPVSVGDYIRSLETHTTPLTRLGYIRDLRLFFRFLHAELPAFGDLAIVSVAPADLERLTLRDLEIYQSYLKQYVPLPEDEDSEEPTLVRNREHGLARKLSALRGYFRYLYKHGLISQNISEKLDMPKMRKKPVIYLEKDEIARMIEAVNSREGLSPRQQVYLEHSRARDLAIICLLVGTGIRASELVGMDLRDVHLGRQEFVVTRKGGAVDTLRFNAQVRDALAAYLALRQTQQPRPGHENALFLSTQMKRLSVRALQDLVKKYAQLGAPLKEHLSPHKLRSTFGTNLYLASGDINLVADILGHSSVNTTKAHYVGNRESRKAQAADLVDWVEEALPEEDPELSD